MSLIRRQLLRTATALALAAFLFALAPASASAHASFLDSTPAPGLRLASAPAQIKLDFTESLNAELSSAKLIDTSTGKAVPTQLSIHGSRMVVQPNVRLRKSVYHVDWHNVSNDDGHALAGSFGFGVKVTPTGAAEQSTEQSPLAGGGWLRIAGRGLTYALLFLFAGGVFGAAVLGRQGDPGSWLLPSSPAASGGPAEGELPPARRLWARTVNLGWLALAAAIVSALLDAGDASGGVSPHDLSAYLLSNTAGLARVMMVAFLAVAAAAAARKGALAAAPSLLLSFAALAAGGHAESADPRVLAIGTDWLHLVAAAVWVGGLSQIAWAWVPRIGDMQARTRLAVMRQVLSRFGRIALPAFLLVAASGIANALIELGHPSALWDTSYGRILMVKIAFVALIALASFTHAFRLRPRLLAANPHPDSRAERLHWRLLGTEPWLGLGAIVAVAVLVAFPLPPRQLAGTSQATASTPCEPFCPLPDASAVQLPVATHAGPNLAAFWIQREGTELVGTMRLLDANMRPVAGSVEVDGQSQPSCSADSPGCWRISAKASGPRLAATISAGGATHRVSVPSVWKEGRTWAARARALLVRAQRTMRGLRGARLHEAVTSGLGATVRTDYRFAAPDRMEYRTATGAHLIAINKRSWESVRGGRYHESGFGGPGPNGGFRFVQSFTWTIYARDVRWLGANKRAVHIALYDPATPAWYRLTIDRASDRVPREDFVTGGHFMIRRWHAFNRPERIVPPR